MPEDFRWSGKFLRVAELDAFAAHIVNEVEVGTPRFVYMMNLYVIQHFLGEDWFQRHASMGARQNSYLRPQFDDRDMAPMYSVRILQLAELLLNLQTVRGFRHCLEHMEGDQLQAGFAELRVGMVLMQRGVSFEYLDPSKDHRNTCDMAVTIPNGASGRCEVKCKYAETPYSNNTLTHALKEAARQIGRGNDGVVFVQIPQDWVLVDQSHPREMAQMELPAEIVAAAKSSLRQYSRIKKLIFYIAQMGFDPDWGISTTHCTMEMNNSRNDPGSLWNVELMGPAENRVWVEIPDLVKRWVTNAKA